jgi:hypothetical protein
VNVVLPGSVALAVNTTSTFSFALLLTLFAVGAVFVHVAVLHLQSLPLHCPSVTFTYAAYVPGSFNVFLYVLLVAHAIVLVHVEFVYH